MAEGPFSEAGLSLGSALHTLTAAALAAEAAAEARIDIRRRWNLPSEDPQVTETAKRLSEAWQDWTPAQRELALQAAESVGTAVHSPRQPSAAVRRHQEKLARLGLRAAQLAEQLLEAFPPEPVAEEPSAVEMLAMQLADFAEAGMTASADDRMVGVVSAKLILEEFRAATPTKGRGRLPNDLLAELAWLSAGRRGQPLEEASLRRFERRREPLSAGARFWRKAYGPLVAARKRSGLSRRVGREKRFDATLQAFLRPQAMPNEVRTR